MKRYSTNWCTNITWFCSSIPLLILLHAWRINYCTTSFEGKFWFAFEVDFVTAVNCNCTSMQIIIASFATNDIMLLRSLLINCNSTSVNMLVLFNTTDKTWMVFCAVLFQFKLNLSAMCLKWNATQFFYCLCLLVAFDMLLVWLLSLKSSASWFNVLANFSLNCSLKLCKL